jgi:hypothetical protein
VAALAWFALAIPAAGAEVVEERLSDEFAKTHWAYPERAESVLSAPAAGATRVGALRMSTELHAPEVYVVLTRRTIGAEVWLQVRLPMRPNGRVGWVPQDALSPLHVTFTSLTINVAKRRATLYESGKRIWSAPVGVGKPGTPTPRGRFWIRQRLHLNGRGGVYGAYAFGTSAYSEKLTDWPGGGVIGIHGTNQPGLIPGAVSHGCVRVRNPQIRDLRRLMGIGTPVWIR